MIRFAQMKDIDAVAGIYGRIHDEEEAGRLTVGWQRGVYPERETALAALERGDLFVLEEDGEVIAAAIINRIQVPEYINCRWTYPAGDNQVMVLHTLVVDPRFAGRGAGSAFVRFYEDYARDRDCTCLRMDTNEKNSAAMALYKKLGYSEPGIVDCTFNGIAGVKLVCLEKKL